MSDKWEWARLWVPFSYSLERPPKSPSGPFKSIRSEIAHLRQKPRAWALGWVFFLHKYLLDIPLSNFHNVVLLCFAADKENMAESSKVTLYRSQKSSKARVQTQVCLASKPRIQSLLGINNLGMRVKKINERTTTTNPWLEAFEEVKTLLLASKGGWLNLTPWAVLKRNEWQCKGEEENGGRLLGKFCLVENDLCTAHLPLKSIL